MSRPIFDTASSADIPQIALLWEACGLTRPWNDPARDISYCLERPESELFIVSQDGAIIGTVMTGADGHRGWVYYLAIAETHRGQGLARRLMREAESWLTARGVWRLNLMVRQDNIAIRDFYDRLGFRTSDVVVLQKDL
ncbi:GNAT family acetyltransferase [Paracoccaceae bacterium GXU_MW_L88]